ncbi:MAG: ATPase [Eubacterium ramulus]
MTSRIEQIISEIEEYIDGCKFQPLSNSKIIVNKEELEELLTELRMKTPDEIKRYQKIISNKDAILADAQAKAEEILAQAQIQTNELVSEHQIMQQAYAQANEVVSIATNQAQEILDKATEDADSIRTAAIEYTDNLLGNLENIVVHAIDTNKAKYEGLLSSLQNCYDIVKANRNGRLQKRKHQLKRLRKFPQMLHKKNSMLLVVQITNQSSCKKCCQHGI